jgi:antitoxin VapB
MSQIAKLFVNGRSQAVRLPAAFRFDAKEVYSRKDPGTGDIILSHRPADWQGFLDALAHTAVPADFLDAAERHQIDQDRDPLADIDP